MAGVYIKIATSSLFVTGGHKKYKKILIPGAVPLLDLGHKSLKNHVFQQQI